MSYDPATDFLGLLRLTAGGVRSERMPGLDYTVAAVSRFGLFALSVGQTEPVVNQATTVWLKPAQPSWLAEGTVYVWNLVDEEYQVATPALWAVFLSGIQPSDDNPLMDGVAAPGISLLYSRKDHVHPTDTTRAPLNSPGLLGVPTAPTAAPGTNTTQLATTAFVANSAGVPVPVGCILPYGGSVVPDASWQFATGQAISRTGVTATLFSRYGITFGAGDGITTFNAPDLRGRVVAGVDGGINRLTTLTMSSQALGGVGGLEAAAILQAFLPAVTLNTAITAGQGLHDHNGLTTAGVPLSAGAAGGGNQLSGASGSAGVTISTNTLPAMVGTTPLGGSGTATKLVQPTIELNYIIRVS